MRFVITAMLLSYVIVGLLQAPQARADGFVEPVWMLDYLASPTDDDYRPAINAAGTRIVFERTAFDEASGTRELAVNLQIADLRSGRVAPLLPTVVDSQPVPIGSSRADWCWGIGGTLFDGPIAFSNAQGVWEVYPELPQVPIFLPGTAGMIYPTWYPHCDNLAVDDTSPGSLNQVALKISATQSGSPEQLTDKTVYAGFASIDPRNSSSIAFAGQYRNGTYSQINNYVFLAGPSTVPKILETNAPETFSRAFQGRAPTWSPDGQWIAFESDRSCGNDSEGNPILAIFVIDSAGQQTPQQVTDCKWNAQHPKWFPRTPSSPGPKLIASLLLHPGSTVPGESDARGIASLDVGGLIGNRQTPAR